MLLNGLLQLTFGLTFLFSTQAHANTSAPSDVCTWKNERIGRFAAQRISTPSNQCLVLISDYKAKDRNQMKYRSYIFSSDGEILIFVSAGRGPSEIMTGGRAFFVMPALRIPDYAVADDGDVLITTADGANVRFAQSTGFISDFSNLQWNESPEINLENNGGVEISSSDRWIVDIGWKIGGHPGANPKGKSTLYKGSTVCAVRNETLLNYVETDDIVFKFKTEAELNAVAQSQCL